MAVNANWRFDPFSNTFITISITDEQQTVALDPVLAVPTIRLQEAPDIPSTGDVLTVVENITGGATWTEVSSSTSPSSGEYRVDRTFDTGVVEFNVADNGKTFLIDYEGKGTIISENNVEELVESFDPLDMTGDVNIAGDLDVTGNFTTSTSGGTAPVGSILAWATPTPPTGWLECDGSAVSRVTYANLFNLFNADDISRYGEGDGSTTFNLPDYRGYFLRHQDGGVAVDPDAGSRLASSSDSGAPTGDVVGTKQADEFDSHTHLVGFVANTTAGSAGIAGSNSAPNITQATQATGGNETRPSNIYVKYIIKF